MSVPTAALSDGIDPAIKRARERAIAVEFLVIARDNYDKAVRGRARCAAMAHEHGVPYREISEVLGVSESTARSLSIEGAQE